MPRQSWIFLKFALADLNEREAAIVQAEAEGRRMDALARRFNVSSARISQQKRGIARRIESTWGTETAPFKTINRAAVVALSNKAQNA